MELAAKLGSRGVRFGHLMSTPLTLATDLVLSPIEIRAVDRYLRELQAAYDFPVTLSAVSPTLDLFPCAPLQSEEFNLDWRGNLGLCCQLASLGMGTMEEVAGNLWTLSLREALERLQCIRQQLCAQKLHQQTEGRWRNHDDFPCWYCTRYFHQVNWLRRHPDHPWYAALNEE